MAPGSTIFSVQTIAIIHKPFVIRVFIINGRSFQPLHEVYTDGEDT